MITKTSNIIAMINARGGSKGIPGKNIKPLAGVPLIAWTIKTAQRVPELSRIVVSTEDQEIARVAKEHGAEIPFMRPDELATDTAVQLDTIIYTLKKLEEEGPRIDAVALLQPTHPLREPADVSGCIQKMIETQADSVITIAPNKYHPYGIWKQTAKGLELLLGKDHKKGFNRQQMEPLFWRTGAVYLIKRETLLNKHSLYGDYVEGYLVDDARSWIDIDGPEDWEAAERWLK